ncbi:MAG TPA: PAS domain S-box protein [Methanotrichaceae archaeon]|nr:PAS domain S-box protein [Methanotrichaceae archaeon]
MFHDAPDPGNALGALSSSRDLFRTMVDQGCDWVYWIGPDGSYVYISPACEHATGFHPDEFIKNPRLMEDIVHPEDREAFSRHIHELSGKSHSFDFRIITRKGEERWISHHCQMAYDSEGIYLGRWASNRDITDQKKMEEALRESEAVHKLLLEIDNDGIILHGLTPAGIPDKIIQANDAMCRMSGYSYEEICNLTPMDLQDEAGKKEIQNESKSALSDGRILFEKVMVTKDGRKVPVEIHTTIVDLHGRPLAISILRDITDRKMMDEALRESKDYLDKIINSFGDPIFVKDRQQRYVLVNDVACIALGLKREEMIGKTCLELFPRELAEIIWERDETIFKTGIEVVDEEVMIDARGSSHTNIVKKTLFRDKAGNEFLAGIVRDITQRKRMEDALRKARDDLEKRVLDRTAEQQKANEALQREIAERKLAEKKEKESREFLDKIINSIGDPLHVKDRQHRMILVNDAACKLFGLTREEMLGRTAYELFPRKEMADISWEMDEEVFRTGIENTNIETNTYAPGVTLTVLVRKTLYTDNAGNKFLVGITIDITDRKLAEDKLIASLQEKEVLIKEVHHRVKNNLQVISSLLNLQGRQTKDEETREAFRDCRNRIRSMALVHEKLYGSKELARIDLADYTKNLTSYLSMSYGIEKRVRIKLDLGDATIGIDKAIPFGLIINELVTNCIKHAFPDGRMGEIRISLHQDTGNLKLVLSDNGVGLSEKYDDPGTKSLGLKLVQTLVTQLKGTIDVHSNGGAEFVIAFDI